MHAKTSLRFALRMATRLRSDPQLVPRWLKILITAPKIALHNTQHSGKNGLMLRQPCRSSAQALRALQGLILWTSRVATHQRQSS